MELVVERLRCTRGGRLVLNDLDFRAVAGRATVLRGPNGVGKSTLLRVLAGLLAPSAGSVTLGPHDLVRDPGGFQDHVAYAGHLDAVKAALTVRQNLALWAGLAGTGAGRVQSALDTFGLLSLADRPAGQCSAGQKRRLGLARLLVADRALWLLDEPTVSLDAASAGLLADLVARHCADGGLALVATHIDMALPGAATLTLTPPAPAAAGGDAFLDGSWEGDRR